MGFIFEQRDSDSPLVETVMQGYTVGSGSTIRPAETHWHLVFVRAQGMTHSIIAGPLTSAGVVHFGGEAEILWVKFKLGAWFPHLPIGEFVDTETNLPKAASQKFWLQGAAWQFPDFENSDTFVNRLAGEELLQRDPLIDTVLRGQPHDLSERTIRHRFQQATGLTQKHITQFDRAQRAANLLRQGVSILDTVHELGYYDQPHLTRSLKQFVGFTPAQLLAANQPD